jgi:hypothetical protein
MSGVEALPLKARVDLALKYYLVDNKTKIEASKLGGINKRTLEK